MTNQSQHTPGPLSGAEMAEAVREGVRSTRRRQRAQYVVHALRQHKRIALGTERTVSNIHAEDAAAFVEHYDDLVAALREIVKAAGGCQEFTVFEHISRAALAAVDKEQA